MKSKFVLGAVLAATTTLAAGCLAQASEIYVRRASGPALTDDQKSEVTDMVRQAVKQAGDQSLVDDETQADFVLQPSVYIQGSAMMLKIEKDKNGGLISSSEQRITAIDSARDSAVAATQAALATTNIASGKAQFSKKGSSSATTEPTDDTAGSHSADNNATATASTDAATTGANTGTDTDQPMSKPATPAQDQAQTQNQDGAPSLDNAQNQTQDVSSKPTADVSANKPVDVTNAKPADAAPAEAKAGTRSTASGHEYGNGILAGGDLRAPSPFIHNNNQLGTLEAGAGPSFGMGPTGQPMLDVDVDYAIPYTENISGKVLADANWAPGDQGSHFLDFGVGADFFMPAGKTFNNVRPYATGDVGYAFTRDTAALIQNAPAVGAGIGFKFAVQETNVDVNAHYTFLTTNIANTPTPSVLAVRAAVNF